MTDRELLEQAAKALERCFATCFHAYAHEQVMSRPEHFMNQAMHALRERLAQPQRTHWEGCEEVHPECKKTGPVAWMYVNTDGECEQIEYLGNEPLPDDPSITPLYTTPPRREWVGLTEEEVDECYYWKGRQWTTDELVRHVEAKLKEKNA